MRKTCFFVGLLFSLSGYSQNVNGPADIPLDEESGESATSEPVPAPASAPFTPGYRRICPGTEAVARYFAEPDGQVAGTWESETPFVAERRSDDGNWILAVRSRDGFKAWVPAEDVCHLDNRRRMCGAVRTELFWMDAPDSGSGRFLPNGAQFTFLETSPRGFAKVEWEGTRYWMWDAYVCPIDPWDRPSQPSAKRLSVPYLCQLNNYQSIAYTSCNLTALAMIMGFHGHPVSPNALFNTYGGTAGSLARIAEVGRIVGFQVDVSFHGTIEDIKAAINRGLPVILGGYFSTGSSGHFVVITGYDETGWWVNDPAGNWNRAPYGGYDGAWCAGQDVHYGYEETRAAASPEGTSNYWIGIPHL